LSSIYPNELRREFGDEMVEVFDEQVSEAYSEAVFPACFVSGSARPGSSSLSLCPVGLPLFNREYADYTSSVHDPSSGFRWFPLSHESRLKITSCVDVASSASLLVLVFDPHMSDKED